MIDELFNQHNFDPTVPWQVLIVEHADSTDQYRIAPLIVITTEDGYKVSRAVFTDQGMKLGLSASFAPNGQLIGGTNDFGSPTDRREAWQTIEELIAAHYLGTETEHHRPGGDLWGSGGGSKFLGNQ